MDEQWAVRQLQRGDIRGLAVLVEHHELAALRAAYLITHDRALAEDVVQAAFVQAYERIAQFDPQRRFGPWFLQIVAHAALKAARRQARSVSLDIEDEDDAALLDRLPDPDPSAQEMLERAETRAAVRAALSQLTPEQRAALVQRYYLGWSEAAMARARRCAPGTVKWRLHVARARLRALLLPLRELRRSPDE